MSQMPSVSARLEPTPPRVEAVVQVGSAETPYTRIGRGPVVLMLCADGIRGPLGTLLGGRLAAQFRVIVPLPLAAASEAASQASALHSPSTWLRGLVDGLGLVRPAVVADERFGLAALDFAVRDPERVGPLVLVGFDSALSERESPVRREGLASGHALLLLRWNFDFPKQDDVAAEVARFLGASEP